MLKIVNVSKAYSNNTVKAVDGLSLELEDGKIVGFIGPNGAGKTTTIKMITGILNPDSGSISINGVNIAAAPLRAKKELGYVPDSANMFLRLKGIEYLNFMGDIYNVGAADRRERIEQLAECFEMSQALSSRLTSYSHGMRQKIVIMGVLLHNPPVWILDEPMTGLDPKSSFQLKELMRNHARQGNTVFFSTHVLDVAERLCDRVAVINKGKLLFNGELEALQGLYPDKTLEQIFLKMTGISTGGAEVSGDA